MDQVKTVSGENVIGRDANECSVCLPAKVSII